MREILFRGKTDKGLWEYGVLCYLRKFGMKPCIVPVDPYDGAGCPDDTVPVSPKTIGQYTGLTDKSGRKIFEGDIVCLHRGATYPMIAFYDGLGFKFRYSNGKLKEGCWDSDIMHDIRLCEVIGNIHENPNLLEGQE